MIATYEPILSVEICSAGAHSEESLAVWTHGIQLFWVME